MARSHRMLPSDSRDNVNSRSAGFAGSSTITPIGVCFGEFRVTRLEFSPMWLNITASAMPPPRLVKRNSTSELRNDSIFSSKIGTDSEPCGAVSGVASGDGEGARTNGDAVGDVCPGAAAMGAGRGAICFARYTSHTTSPTTQRATTIQAVRSINLVLHD